MADRSRHRRLAESTRAAQRDRSRPVRRQQRGSEPLAHVLSLDVLERQLRCHERHVRRLAAAAKMRDQLRPFVVEVVEVRPPHPARQPGEVELRVDRGLDWIHADPALARAAPLASGVLRTHRGRRHHQQQELGAVELLIDLLPPAHTAFNLEPVEPGLNVGRIGGQAIMQRPRMGFTIAARVRDEGTLPGVAAGSHKEARSMKRASQASGPQGTRALHVVHRLQQGRFAGQALHDRC
jgi:hypothetical protein